MKFPQLKKVPAGAASAPMSVLASFRSIELEMHCQTVEPHCVAKCQQGLADGVARS